VPACQTRTNAATVLSIAWIIVFAMTCLALFSGCAGTARGKDSSLYRQTAAMTGGEVSSHQSSALVVIRYPAMIHADAETLYVSSFAVNAIGGEVPYSQFGKPQTARIAQSLVAKSSYYAMSLYQELSRVLPEHSVLLSPHIIDWSDVQQLYSRPILAAEQVPSVLTVDFNIYSFPDVNEMMDSPPVTFGDLVTPLMVVKTDAWGEPGLNGVLIASEPLTSSAWRQSKDTLRRQIERRATGRAAMEAAPLDFISFLAERSQPQLKLPTRSVSDSGARIAIESYPVEKIQMDGQLMVNLEETYSTDPFVRDFVAGAARRVMNALQDVDHDRATLFARQAALARFDPELSEVFFMQSAQESVRSRMRLAEALVRAEIEFLSAQSETIYQGTFEGDYGFKMRKIIEAEYRMLEERRRLARVQNWSAAMAAMAMAGSVYVATVSTTASSALVAGLSGLSLVGSVWAMNRAIDARAESEEINEAFVARMAPAFARQMSVQVEWLESREIITAQGFAEFRNKTLTLYQSRVRSMAVEADQQCDFRYPGLEGAGRWYGRCEAGLASGRGYGVLSNGGRASLEYVGEAAAGWPEGAGRMVYRDGKVSGTTYLEGYFLNGWPEGVLRVEQAGQSSRLREYREGRDVGRGNPSQWRKPAGAPGIAERGP
jgi:hypothetical protein